LVGSNVQAGPKRLIIPPARNVPNKKLFRKCTTGSDTTSSAEGDAGPSSVPTEVDLILSPLDNDDGEGDGKKIMAEAYAVVYHDRQPSDTLQSICFQYNVTPDKIRRANNFRGNDLVYAPDRLVIPITTPKSELTNDEKVESLQSQLSKLSLSRDDAVSFLELNDWNLSRTIRNVNVQKRYFSNNRE
jgi:LysM repeat protein